MVQQRQAQKISNLTGYGLLENVLRLFVEKIFGMIEMKTGMGSFLEGSVISRRTEIRTWSRDDVRANLDGPLRNVSVLARDVEARGRVLRMPLTEALYRHKIDGNALLELREDDLMQWIGVCEIGVAKTLLRTVDSLVATRTTIRRPNSAPVNRTIRYSSLDPFDGWDAPDEGLHPKRNRIFRVCMANKSTRSIVSLATQTQDCVPDSIVTESVGVSTDDLPSNGTMSNEVMCETRQGFSLGPLEQERRVAECRSMFDVLRSTQAVNLGWIVDSAVLCLDLAPSQACGIVQRCYTTIVTARTRGSMRPKSANKFDRVGIALPQQDSLANMRSVILSRADFIAVINILCGEREPKVFDGLFQFLSKKFGSEYIETCRRTDSVRQLYDKMSPLSTEVIGEVISAVFGNETFSTSPLSTLKNFCEAFLHMTEKVSGEEFDQIVMNASLAALKKVDGASKMTRKKLLSETDLMQIVEQSTPQKMILLLSSKLSPTSLLEKLFLSLREDQSRLITSRQKNLVVLGVGGEDSINSTVTFISTGGFEKGQWVLAVCAPSHGNFLLNTFLRKLACAISCRTTASISNQFRVFVHCPIDTVDIISIPQIAQSSSVVVPL